jgi:hypothetical protein
MVSVRRVAPILLLALAVPVLGAKRATSSHPPRELHRVGDHYTAWNPPDPSTYPPNAKTYTIKRGDTLWTLAQQFYGNAYLWPQLWESNAWITDAHWIYGGDVLLVEGEAAARAASTSASSGTTTSTAQPGTGQTPVTTAAGRADMTANPPVPLGTEADVYCYGYIGSPNEPLPNRIMSFEDEEMLYAPGEVIQDLGASNGYLVYIDGGTVTGIVAGETYLVVQPSDLVTHPRSNGVVGEFYEYRGQIRILCADEHRSRGIVTQSCMDLHVGDALKPLPQIPIPLARVPNVPEYCDPASGRANGYIVLSQGGWSDALGEGHLVEINLGRDDQLQPGDFLTVWRDSMVPGVPRQILGEIGILTTEAHTATAKIVRMRYGMRVGDHVEMR